MAQILRVPTENALQFTLDSQLSLGGTTLTLNQDVSSLVRSPGRLVIDRINTSEEETPSKREFIGFTGVSGATLTGLSRGLMGSSDQAHAVGAIVEFVPDVETINSIYDTFDVEHDATDGSHTDINVDSIAGNTEPFVIGPHYDDWVTATDGATVTFDVSTGQRQTVTLGGNRTLAFSNFTAGTVVVLELVQDGTGSRTVTWPAEVKWAGGTAPTLTTTPAAKDAIILIKKDASNIFGYELGLAMS